ncbi:HEAT repeat domain-containing protein [Tundrisphaera sp. TA3]|uniref:HEAT repeat domain-containing protein n=1 Tax=Tundrisphaera sp. TA3 TaxID=3435775 RepID=UPI003EC0ECAC
MIAMIVGLATLLGPMSTAGSHGHRVKIDAPRVCQACGVDGRATLPLITRLQSDPRWKVRDDAAHALAKFDWRAHPEVVYALCDALLLDPKDDVREEAAEALRDMAPCVPVAHQALRQAAMHDPEDDVREEAREALGRLRRRRCIADCTLCGPASVIVLHGPSALPPAWVPMLIPPSSGGGNPLPGDPPVELDPLPPALPEQGPSMDPGSGLEPILEGPMGSRTGRSRRG